MTFNNDDGADDMFGMRIIEWCENKSSNEDYGLFEADETLLKSLNERDLKNYIYIFFLGFCDRSKILV